MHIFSAFILNFSIIGDFFNFMHFISAKNNGYYKKRSDQTLIGSPLTGSQAKAKGRTSQLRECLASKRC